jgi:hypothetical protein
VGLGLGLEVVGDGTFEVGFEIDAADDADDFQEVGGGAGGQAYVVDAYVFQPDQFAFPEGSGEGGPGEFYGLGYGRGRDGEEKEGECRD